MIGILGGGISGICLQYFLRKESFVLEASTEIGGLCRTFFHDGFGFDIGGHILFSKYEEINRLVGAVLGDNIVFQRRENRILFKDRFVKYPFENDLFSLDPSDRFECLYSYLNNSHPSPSNLKEWCYFTFGTGISERYLIPYNEKIWKTPAEKISMGWVSRIPRPPVEDVIKSAVGVSTEGYVHQLNFGYPKNGGAQALVEAFNVKPDQVFTSSRALQIIKEGDGWKILTLDNEFKCKQLVSTIPIFDLLPVLSEVPQFVTQAVNRLHYNSLILAFIAVDNERLLDLSAVYIPDPEILPHRVCYMGYFSRTMVVPNCSSLVAEITTAYESDLYNLPDEVLLERVISDLRKIKILEGKVLVSKILRVKYAYPLYTTGYEKDVQLYKEYFSSIGIHLLGRFSEFDYINSDECIRRASVLSKVIDI